MPLLGLRSVSTSIAFKSGYRNPILTSTTVSPSFRFNQHSYSNPSVSSIKSRNMSAGVGIPSNLSSLSASELGIESMNEIQTAPGVELDAGQRVLVASVLDLFAGKPTLKKLSLWSDNATFADPLTNATGRKQYSAQWYGLAAVFSSITRISHSVTSSTNPITMELKTNYKLKGVGKETVIESLVEIWVGDEGKNGADGEGVGEEGDRVGTGGVGGIDRGKIVKVLDKWNGEIPEGIFARAFRNLNAVTVPVFVSVPKDEEQETKK